MRTALLIAATAALTGSAGGASAQMDRHKPVATHCRHMDSTMRHPKGCARHLRCSGCPGMGKMSGMEGMDHSGASGAGQMMGPGHVMEKAPVMGDTPAPSPIPTPKP